MAVWRNACPISSLKLPEDQMSRLTAYHSARGLPSVSGWQVRSDGATLEVVNLGAWVKLRRTRLRLSSLAIAALALLIGTADRAAARGEHSAESNKSHSAASGSRSMMPRGGSCAHPSRVASGDVRRPPVSSASSRRMRTITPTCMTTPTCLTCSGSPGPA
jgi:hypothetical protein